MRYSFVLMTATAVSLALGGAAQAGFLTQYTGDVDLTVGTTTYGTHKVKLGGSASTVTAGSFWTNTVYRSDLGSLDFVLMFCVDLEHFITPGVTYTANANTIGDITVANPTVSATDYSDTVGPTSGVLSKAGEIAYLLRFYGNDAYDAAVGQNAYSSANKTRMLGLQAAIWELVYGDDFDDSYYALNNSAAVVSRFNDLLDFVDTGDFSSYVDDVLWINPKQGSTYKQAQVGFDVLPPDDGPLVPVPSSLAMLISLVGTSFAGRYGSRYFKNKKAAA